MWKRLQVNFTTVHLTISFKLILNYTTWIKQQTRFSLEMRENAAYERICTQFVFASLPRYTEIISACHHLLCAVTANTGSVGGRRSTQMSFLRKWSQTMTEKYPCTTRLLLTIMPLGSLFASLSYLVKIPAFVVIISQCRLLFNILQP